MTNSKPASHPAQPLVSVIVPTKNSAQFLEACLASIQAQTYPNLELIVVDNHSTDATQAIAKRFTEQVFTKGPERSAQVNYGVSKAQGEFVYKVDSDFVLEPNVVDECVKKAANGFDAVVVHNTPDESVSWIARVRKFEVDMYKYDLTHSSARFVRGGVYKAVGGFNERITAGEDYDFQNKLNRAGYKTGFIEAEALHLGEPKHLWSHLIKMYQYGRDSVHYQQDNRVEFAGQFKYVLLVWFHHWQQFLRHPLKAVGLILYLGLKFGFGGAGYIAGLALPSKGYNQ